MRETGKGRIETEMKAAQVVLAIIMALCLLEMPYGYYTIVRFLSMIVFGVMAGWHALECCEAGKDKKIAKVITIVSGVLALLFQPIVKISLGRGLWNFLDIVAALFLIGVVIWETYRKSGNKEQK